MPQIKVIVQEEEELTGVTGANFGDAYPLKGALTLAIQNIISNQSSLSGASAIMQVSADPEDVTPSNWTDYGSSQNITANGALFFSKVNPEGNWIRMKYAISSGSFDVTNNIVVKGPN